MFSLRASGAGAMFRVKSIQAYPTGASLESRMRLNRNGVESSAGVFTKCDQFKRAEEFVIRALAYAFQNAHLMVLCAFMELHH